MVNPLDPLGLWNGSLKRDYDKKILASLNRQQREDWTRTFITSIILSIVYQIMVITLGSTIIVGLGNITGILH